MQNQLSKIFSLTLRTSPESIYFGLMYIFVASLYHIQFYTAEKENYLELN